MTVKNKYGQYFTIDFIADFMVSLISHAKDSKVVEPSCGKGVFLDNLIKQGFSNITAYEIDTTLEAKYDFPPEAFHEMTGDSGIGKKPAITRGIRRILCLRFPNQQFESKRMSLAGICWNMMVSSLFLKTLFLEKVKLKILS